MLPRRLLFGHPHRTNVRLSPDGTRLAFLAPAGGVLNVFVGPVEDPDVAVPVTRDTARGIRMFAWAYDGAHLLYLQDAAGDEDWHIYRAEVEGRDVVDLTPAAGISAQIVHMSPRHPRVILAATNERDPSLHDVYRIDLLRGERERIVENPSFSDFLCDDELRVRMALRMEENGSTTWHVPDGDGWREMLRVPYEDSLQSHPIAIDAGGRHAFVLDSRGRDTAALCRLDLESGDQELIFADSRADVSGALLHPATRALQAVSVNYDREQWHVLDAEIEPDFERLRQASRGALSLPSRTLDDRRWLAAYVFDDGPVRYELLDRDRGETRFLFSHRPELEDVPLARMQPQVVRARDGLSLVCYLTRPKHDAAQDDSLKPSPLVLLVHGGPWARDAFGFDPFHQLLADRGYAVLSVNFRGSTGFGKRFLNAGDREWGARMHDDLLDAVEWAIAEGIADPARVAIMGGSYGGYAVLHAMTCTPELFACGVDIVGPSNLVTLLESLPPYWKPQQALFRQRVGDHTTEEGRAFLRERSPLTHAARICRPLLIAQGANDPRVKRAESDQIVAAMQARSIAVTYVLYPDEGHGFARPENSLAFAAIAEAFLARHLGGTAEPIGDAFAGASAQLLAGEAELPDVAGALRAAR
jgi:dipeptidyl aminopeptidase/acylaminoacyl peptidase